jgi:hypothetical protein
MLEGRTSVLALGETATLDLNACSFELLLEMCDEILGARVGPHDGLAERLAGFATPGDGGLPLVRDTCTNDVT